MDWILLKECEPSVGQWILYVSRDDAAIYLKNKYGTPDYGDITVGQYVGGGKAEWWEEMAPDDVFVWIPIPDNWPAVAAQF